MDRPCRSHNGNNKAYKIVVGTLHGNRPLGIPRNKWEDNTKIEVRKRVFGYVD
jgi:hypothetical protein